MIIETALIVLYFLADPVAPDPVVTLMTGLMTAGGRSWLASQAQQVSDQRRRIEDLEDSLEKLTKDVREKAPVSK